VTFVLRTGNDRDWPAVGDLHHRSRADAYRGFLSARALAYGSGSAMGEYWAERGKWEADTHRLTVAERDGRIIGFTYLGPSEQDGVGELCAIHVDPAELGTGVGRELMRDALTKLAALGDRAVLWVLDGNDRARRFYEKGGWSPTGVVRDDAIGGEPTRQVRYSRVVGGSA
jgi:GNAT superfamily N-acetyltransferase